MANIGNLMMTAVDAVVVRGFAEKLIDRLIAVGAASRAWASREVPGCCVDTERMKVVLTEMLQDAGVAILTHALGARPIMNGTKVEGAFIESKSCATHRPPRTSIPSSARSPYVSGRPPTGGS